MIRTTRYIVLVIVLGVAAIFFFLRTLDSAIEIDDLKSQIRLQQEGLQFLQSVANDALTSCRTTVERFETAAHANGHTVVWQGQVALVGPFRVTKQDSCVVKIEQVGLFYTKPSPAGMK